MQQAACILAAGLKDWVDLGVIIGLLLLNACVGFAQDYSAGNIVNVSWRNILVSESMRTNERDVGTEERSGTQKQCHP